MKKMLPVIFILVFAVSLMGGCAEFVEAVESIQESAEAFESPEIVEPVQSTPPALQYDDSDTITIEGLLYDLDSLMEDLNENYPFFGILERRFGYSLHEIFESVREYIADSDEPIDIDEFIEIMNEQFFQHVRRPGHLQIVTREQHIAMVNNIMRNFVMENGELQPSAQHSMNHSTNPAVLAHYGEVIVDLETTEDFQPSPDNLFLRTFEEESFAYLWMSWLPVQNMEYDRQPLLDFFHEIADFDDLIIDLRGNPGGFPQYFRELVMSPNISEPLEIPIFVFHSGGEDSMAAINAHIETQYLMHGNIIEILPAETIITEYNMENFELQDLEWLDYGFVTNWTVEPEFDEAIFTGKIWILIDERTASAAEQAAIL
ncbi:MAG: S41 family peptidase, partial [Defluviitaleaceae bacterium]|nr:S41 family peptidase [Defluviitaleaceae bacterium]